MKKLPIVNLGQSEFQDTLMVVGAEDTPFRKLRKVELHINEIKAALKHNEFEVRKTLVKIKRLNSEDELEAIEIEEMEYGLKQSKNLINDAEGRLANFEEIKGQILKSAPDEYWDQGFEGAEAEHWINYYSKRVALDRLANGSIGAGTLEQIMVLPDELAATIMLNAPRKEQRMVQISAHADEGVKLLEEEHKKLLEQTKED